MAHNTLPSPLADSVTLRIPHQSDAHSLADQLAAAGHPLNTRCGQRGLCKGCEIQLDDGEVVSDGKMITAPARIKACQSMATGELVVSIPVSSRMAQKPFVAENFRIDVPHALEPALPVIGQRDIGFAVDIGTTTVVVQLVDLTDGQLLGRASAYNAQCRFGDNVVTRIAAAADPLVLKNMQHAVVTQSLVPLLRRALLNCGRQESALAGGVVAGNTTMLHLLAGVDPTPMGVAPFAAPFLQNRWLNSAELGMPSPFSNLPVGLLPSISAYLGADISAGAVATGLAYEETPALLIDAGTNGEMLLCKAGEFWGCATAAGPAFEGCGLRSGSRAEAGAIAALQARTNPWEWLTFNTLGAPITQASGLCGSAYLDFLAESRRVGLLTPSGRFAPDVWQALPDLFRRSDKAEKLVRVCGGVSDRDIVISEVDIAQLLQAKAAIAAGIECLLSAAGMSPYDLGKIYLAGGFGTHMNAENAIACGFLPAIATDRIHGVGNSSLAGAVLALRDRAFFSEMDSLRDRVHVLELNLQPHFEDRFIDHLTLP